MNKRQSPRLKDVAEKANVDISIASRILNDDPDVVVLPETRERILRAARELGYRPNALGRGLRRNQTMTLGLLVPDVANVVYFEIIRGAEQCAFEEGYVLLLTNAHEYEKEAEAYERLVMESRVDGLLIASATDSEGIHLSPNERPRPCVWINRKVEETGPNVIEDDEAGIALGVQHLAELGHRRIAHIAGPQHLDTGRRRLQGFRTAMQELDLEIQDNYIVEGLFTERGGFQGMQALATLSSPPTAVVASSFSAAIGALAAAKKASYRIPEDMSVVAFHDTSIAGYLDPPLTTISMPLREIGELGVRTLLRLLAGDDLNEQTMMVTTPPKLIKRASTAPPPQR